jgi:hypothetical protein
MAITMAKVTPVRLLLRDDHGFCRHAHEPPNATLTAVIIKISRIAPFCISGKDLVPHLPISGRSALGFYAV